VAVVTKLIGISGSLRRGSFNTALLRAAAEFVPDGAKLTVETIHGIPLYDADVETADGIPKRVAALKEAIVAADGLLLATPEYNNSIPGVFKNAIDGLSRPPADIGRVFGGNRWRYLGRRPAASARPLARMHGCLSCGPWDDALVRRAPCRVRCRERLRRSRPARKRYHKGTASAVPRRLRSLCPARP
jgi:NAD(P)H-dependent FMN reductase